MPHFEIGTDVKILTLPKDREKVLNRILNTGQEINDENFIDKRIKTSTSSSNRGLSQFNLEAYNTFDAMGLGLKFYFFLCKF